ncbi:MAG: hypothetical protein AAF602_05480 [Myxococcota bacterium]
MVLLGWLACGLVGADDEVEPTAPASREVRSVTMQHHQVAVLRARDAVIAQDLAGVRSAGERLAVERDVPMLPPPAGQTLVTVREAGAQLAKVADLDQAAEIVVELTATCARCHTMLEVPPAAPLQATQADILWTALTFRSEEHWQEGARRDPRLRDLRHWEDRRLVLTARLQGQGFGELPPDVR